MKADKSFVEAFAVLGARERLKQLDAERASIVAAFPELDWHVKAGKTRRRVASPAARKAMSDGMRRFWARRKAKAAK
jgi:hypothetical protein